MIAHICGTLVQKNLSQIVVDVHGVGYLVHISLNTYYELPNVGEKVTLYIHTYLRDHTITLYGFLRNEECVIFQQMISVSGIGPRLAMNILSGMPSVGELIKAICDRDVKRLTAIPGVGRKMGERLVLELKERVDKLSEYLADVGVYRGTDYEKIKEDVLSALINLGYKKNQAKLAIEETLVELDDKPTMEELLRGTLRRLAS
ncbi:MAG: Holliday junction branch migration protein RuvA [Syntrophales bacterium]|nr:Holliday junction branch migration protein RuvA [Syntrophales bacterium]